MKKLGVFVVALLLLTGCAPAGQGGASQTPTPTQPANATACKTFESATRKIATAINNSDTIDRWQQLKEEFDSIGLSASGDVKERILSVVDGWPERSQIVIYRDVTGFNQSLESVSRACSAEGTYLVLTLFDEPD